jgi:hypothetical protein
MRHAYYIQTSGKQSSQSGVRAARPAFESEVQKSTLDPIKESLVCCRPSGTEEDASGIAEAKGD